MFPITINYIEREYTIGGNHFLVTSDHTAKIIEQKARTVLALLKRGIKFMPTQRLCQHNLILFVYINY